MISIIVAMDEHHLIGKDGTLPWRNKEDLKHFKQTTLHHALLMGSVTYRSLPKKLEDRTLYVLTKDPTFTSDDPSVIIIHELQPLIKKYQRSEEVLYVAGGASIYQQVLPYVDELLISKIPGHYEGDRYFPEFEPYFTLKETKDCETFTLEIYQKR